MKRLPGLGQQDEHCHRGSIARELISMLISVHHLPDHSDSPRALMLPFQIGPSDGRSAFVINLSRGLQLGQIAAHIHRHESGGEEHRKRYGHDDRPNREGFLFVWDQIVSLADSFDAHAPIIGGKFRAVTN
jgi:hypothetical protein